MISKKWYIKLDVQKQYDNELITMIKQDIYSNELYISLFNNGRLVKFDDVTHISVVVDKSDSTKVIGSGEIIRDGLIKYTVDHQAIAALGIATVTLKIHTLESVMATAIFNINIIADPYAGTDASIESTSEYTVLQDLINKHTLYVEAENSRAAAELLRVNAETNRTEVEATRVNNEVDRVGKEEIRLTNETIRVSSEDTRELDEGLRKQAEVTREESELNRVNAEIERMSSEVDRKLLEESRNINEGIRETAEAARIIQEQDRKSAEVERNTDESTRRSNEVTRISNETNREDSEMVRVSNENARNVFENYNNAKSYVVGNKVFYQSSSYRCIVNAKGIAPISTSHWMLIARKGDVYFPTFSVDSEMQLKMHDDFNYDGTITFILTDGYLIQEVI